MFVSLDKLLPVHTLSKPPIYPKKETKDSVEFGTDSKPKTEHRHKIGDRVVVFNKNEVAVHGVVKWVGSYNHTVKKKQVSYSCRAVGIETVSS